MVDIEIEKSISLPDLLLSNGDVLKLEIEMNPQQNKYSIKKHQVIKTDDIKVRYKLWVNECFINTFDTYSDVQGFIEKALMGTELIDVHWKRVIE